MSEEDNWEELWDARMQGMEKTFGPHDDSVLHGTIPFHIGQDLGGSPDVVMFSKYTDGKLYVTADLIGSEQTPNSAGNYELAVVHKGDEDWGVNIICQLAYYTLENLIDDGETMDIGSATPEDSSMEALLFRRIAQFDVLGIKSNVICCIGITGPELEYSHKKGSTALIMKLGNDFLGTDLYRESII
ncbi:MAG: suppressor of fused domain protein [Candidatus Thiodiazotropha sp. (ex Lucinoma kastoroae)]|nr:suppressor of fused domain protein [Candidatus Thiodiazotropha sp. (ex Lucinoma kastoroae)]